MGVKVYDDNAETKTDLTGRLDERPAVYGNGFEEKGCQTR